MIKNSLYLLLIFVLAACGSDEPGESNFTLVQAYVGTTELSQNSITENLPTDRSISLSFSSAVDANSLNDGISLTLGGNSINLDFTLTSENKTVIIYPGGGLQNSSTYLLNISTALKSTNGGSAVPAEISFKTIAGDLALSYLQIGSKEVVVGEKILNAYLDLDMIMTFTVPVEANALKAAVSITGTAAPNLEISSDDNLTFNVSTASELKPLTKYTLKIKNTLLGNEGETFEGFEKEFYTQIDSTYKFPEISDEALLTKVQEQTFKYFWDFAHPVSGLARERNTSGDLVTTGGSGFGVMTILVGIERGFITRQEGVDRLEQIVDFLQEADRFHGVWPHWMNGETGAVIPFSTKDDGGDLVETAFMIQGLLTVREYLNESNAQEKAIIENITTLWEEVEWDWYTQGEEVLYWHWSPNYAWEMNHQIKGWNEGLIVYVLAASSPTHSISASVYFSGWASSGGMENGNSYYGYNLPLGYEKGGPLFFAHYSFLGLDPRNLEDGYANYWTQNVNHTMINRAYCIQNPQGNLGYGEGMWGLTASDNYEGYSAHSPTNDKGVITPTAALSSMPYSPDESMEALKSFYYLLGDKLWGDYGFYDAYSLNKSWYASSYLAIDQGPIIIMIENHRTGLLWDTFMQNEEITSGLDKLNFTSY
ncbi:glucoamylase family protein [Fulvivirga ligni]|uniref:glucoamylase family protein n=1 Tax=Fulvivirga ligni TaxID=2904246 RepID=UPI001F390388|nr:glucoamylase family protein [Fulvivirga ligni]UII21988.1 Ig-like domain-containing protein [Fulvivirga ligni]